MSVSPELKKFVDDGDLIQIRCYLTNYLVVDRTFALFDESLAYAADRLPVIQAHDGSVLEQDKAMWNRDYLNHQIVGAFSNFSQERITHIKEVVTHIAGEREPVASSDSPSAHGSNIPSKHNRTGRRVLEETEDKTRSTGQPVSAPHRSEATKKGTASSRLGRHKVSETEVEKKPDEDPAHPAVSGAGFDVGTAMIVGGVALAVVGVAMTESIVIGAGAAVAGIGAVVKIANNRR